jgi:hypothetical protein
MLELDITGDEVTLSGTVKGNTEHQKLVPRPWVWSRRASGYVLPRSLLPLTRNRHITWLVAAAQAAGIELQVNDSETTLSEADRRQARTGRLEDRADRHEHVAEKAAATAAATEAAAALISYPPGQPILVGHHSEGRHRRDLARRDRLDQKSLEAQRLARQAARLAEGIRRTLERGDAPVTIRLRIERHEAEIRSLTRTLDRHPDETRAAEKARLSEAVAIDRATIAQMEADGTTVTYSRDNVAKGDQVQYGDLWLTVLRVNTKTVTVPSLMGDWTNTLPYAKITGRRPGRPAS